MIERKLGKGHQDSSHYVVARKREGDCKYMINNKWSEDDFPSDNLPSGIFPNVQLPKQQLPEGQVRPSKAPLSVMGGPPSTKLTVRSVVICTTLTEDIVGFRSGPRVAAMTDLGCYRLRNCTFGKLPLGKSPFGKYLTSYKIYNI